jgi:hypothetical protein
MQLVMQTAYLRWTAASLIALIIAGCVSLNRPIMSCPLTYSEQEKQILAVVPKGTQRQEALRRLAAAGIEGSFGISQRVYYCDLWNRKNGERWHVNVALLFDDADKLYRTQVADCAVFASPTGKGGKGDAASGSSASPAANADTFSPAN